MFDRLGLKGTCCSSHDDDIQLKPRCDGSYQKPSLRAMPFHIQASIWHPWEQSLSEPRTKCAIAQACKTGESGVNALVMALILLL